MINCLIIDDEPLALDVIEAYVKKTPFLNLIARCSGVVDAMREMEKNEIQLLFLDIQMPDLSGMQFSQTLSDKIKVVFTTAFEQYALEGFKVNALGYLLKPFSYAEFLEVANRAKEWFDMANRTPLSTTEDREDSLFVKSEYKILKIAFDEIIYIEGLKDYVKFYLTGKDRPILSLMSLKILEEKLPKKFMRVHRSFIVNLEKIETIQRNEIVFGKVSIPIADKHKEEFQEFVKSKFFE
jgi:DNA-binding LytR/AlgR family response regulator